MASALIDSSIVLKMITARLEASVSGVELQHLGEPETDSTGIQARVAGFQLDRHGRNRSDGQEDNADLEVTIEVLADAASMETAINAITKASMDVVAGIDQVRLTDSSTNHDLHLGRCREAVGTGEDEKGVFGMSTITVSGVVKRTSGTSIV